MAIQTYTVPAMGSGHCRAAIISEVEQVAGVASVDVDLETKRVTVAGESVDDAAVRAAIDEAGYDVASGEAQSMLCAVNRTLRRERRRLAVLAAVLGLAGVVVVAHTAMNNDHLGDAIVTCLAMAETAVAAAGAALALAALWARPVWPVIGIADAKLAVVLPAEQARSRAGPPRLGVFRL